jgi:two-component system sensor histidine kinase KdpD
MSPIEAVLPLKNDQVRSWDRYLFDSLLASAGAGLVTGLIAIFHLYPRIPNISIVYLLIVLALATTRGRFAAILASVVAFLSFDFFIVPPLYTFVIYHVEEWIALFVFLIDALLTSQLAVALRERAEQASRRERETRILYELVRMTNREEEPERQLDAIVRAVKEVLAPWGIQDCALLQPDTENAFHIRATTTPASCSPTQTPLCAEEQTAATWSQRHGRFVTLYEPVESGEETALIPPPTADASQRLIPRNAAAWQRRRSVCLIPLTLGLKGIGVLRLSVCGNPGRFPPAERLGAFALGDREHASFFWTFLDQVTALVERARLQQETVRMAVLERTDALRVALLSSVSHDLRTPLTAIKAAASSLLQRDVHWDEEARRGFAEAIVREADRLNRLVGNLLDMSRIEEGALKPEKEEYSLTALIQDVLDRLEPLFVGRRVEAHLPDNLLLVEIDYLQIDQVLTNLLENAVRHTPAGTPLDVSAHLKEHEIVIRIADRGPGIPQADLERVFDKFYRVLHDQRSAQPAPGSGLGLAVCRGLVEAHGGRIWAQGREGGGLVVSIALPAATLRKGASNE